MPTWPILSHGVDSSTPPRYSSLSVWAVVSTQLQLASVLSFDWVSTVKKVEDEVWLRVEWNNLMVKKFERRDEDRNCFGLDVRSEVNHSQAVEWWKATVNL